MNHIYEKKYEESMNIMQEIFERSTKKYELKEAFDEGTNKKRTRKYVMSKKYIFIHGDLVCRK